MVSDEEREEMRRYAKEEAEQAGLDDDTVDAVVDMAMGSGIWMVGDQVDRDYFEEFVAGVIQGHAMP
jgi:hypothetical protein